MRVFAAVLPAALLAGCVTIPGVVDEDHLERAAAAVSSDEGFAGLAAGAVEQTSQHFVARAYGAGQTARIAAMAETAYSRIMVDTGLFSFQPSAGLYNIVVYANADEYHRKTGEAGWSDGIAAGRSIYSYDGPGLDAALSHAMTHLVFRDFIGHDNLDYRWVDEGLAVYEESKAGQPASGGAAPALRPWPQGWQPLGQDSLVHLAPASERERDTSAWFRQAGSMVRFMIERGGRIGFGQFLSDLRQDATFDKAIGDSFQGSWNNLASFNAAWVAAQQ